jgi:hypothetical protein
MEVAEKVKGDLARFYDSKIKKNSFTIYNCLLFSLLFINEYDYLLA